MESHRRPWQDCGGLPWQSEQCRRLRCRHTGLAVVSLAGVGGRRGLRAGTSLVRGHAVGQHILRGLHQVATHPRMSVGPVGGDVFAAERPRLVGLAYRMLAMVEDAEDVVQEAWIRWQAVDPTGLERPAAWLTTVTTRLALDQLRSRSRRREDYVGPWLPEPLVSAPGPEEAAELADSLTLGFLTLLDRLTPIERAVFVLADVFDVPYAEIAETVAKSAPACRQIATRARRQIRESRPHPASPVARQLVTELVGAITAGDIGGVLARLAPEAVCVTDGGATRRAARRPILGAPQVARFLIHLAQRFSNRLSLSPVTVNGDPGFILTLDGAVDQVLAFEVKRNQVLVVRMIGNPAKLQRIHDPVRLR